jgi:HEXXH motif-containing protein
MMAPETVYRTWQFRKSPVQTIAALCGFLNAECALKDPGAANGKPYWTALGDFYHSGRGGQAVAGGESEMRWAPDQSFCAPLVAEAIPIDFFSPNVGHAKETTVKDDFLEFSPQEMVVVRQRLSDVFARIAEVSEAAARLVKEFVKVIIPLKVPSGCGSTSERSFPGRVLLQGVEVATPSRMAAALVHEAIHQLLYVLEYEGRFVITEPEGRVKSFWTGRALQLHSFFHACFVWYGLANFWALARNSDAFEGQEVDEGLSGCLSGFQGQNPVDVLNLHPGSVRGDALSIASKLQDRLQVLMSPAVA